MALHSASELSGAVMSGMYVDVNVYFASINLAVNFGVGAIN